MHSFLLWTISTDCARPLKKTQENGIVVVYKDVGVFQGAILDHWKGLEAIEWPAQCIGARDVQRI